MIYFRLDNLCHIQVNILLNVLSAIDPSIFVFLVSTIILLCISITIIVFLKSVHSEPALSILSLIVFPLVSRERNNCISRNVQLNTILLSDRNKNQDGGFLLLILLS